MHAGTELLTSVSIFLVAYSFQQNLFSTFKSLRTKTNKNAMVCVSGAISLSMVIYLLVGVLAMLMYGSSIQSNMLDNIDDTDNWESYMLRGAFLIVVSCHIPFIFFAGKESFLNMYFEAKSRSISRVLEMKKTMIDSRIELSKSKSGDKTGGGMTQLYEKAKQEDDENDSYIHSFVKDNKKSEIYNLTKQFPFAYILIVSGIYIVEMLGGIFIDDVSNVFNFVASIACSSLAFTFPGAFFIALEGRYSQNCFIGKENL